MSAGIRQPVRVTLAQLHQQMLSIKQRRSDVNTIVSLLHSHLYRPDSVNLSAKSTPKRVSSEPFVTSSIPAQHSNVLHPWVSSFSGFVKFADVGTLVVFGIQGAGGTA